MVRWVSLYFFQFDSFFQDSNRIESDQLRKFGIEPEPIPELTQTGLVKMPTLLDYLLFLSFFIVIFFVSNCGVEPLYYFCKSIRTDWIDIFGALFFSSPLNFSFREMRHLEFEDISISSTYHRNTKQKVLWSPKSN